jgi:hypothetical protein
VPRAGLEPTRSYEPDILSVLCLPFHHPGRCLKFILAQFSLCETQAGDSSTNKFLSSLIYGGRFFDKSFLAVARKVRQPPLAICSVEQITLCASTPDRNEAVHFFLRLKTLRLFLRRRRESNPRMVVLQTTALGHFATASFLYFKLYLPSHELVCPR